MKLLHHSVFSLPPNILFTPPHPLFLLPHLTSSLYKPTIIHSLSVHRLCSEPEPWLSQFAGSPIVAAAIFDPSDIGGPVELPPDAPSVFAVADEPGALQVGYSILLFGAVTFFVFRSLRRRAKRAKELRFRSSGVKKTLKDEALENLKAIENLSVEPGSPPSPAQALLGGLTAGVIALVLYKFTATVETTLSRQVVSDNYSARQITITIRTIINGLCYLATFIFGINSVGLFLYSGQLAINSFMEGAAGRDTKTIDEKQPTVPKSSPESPTEGEEGDSRQSDNSSDFP